MVSVILIILVFVSMGILGLTMIMTVINYYYDNNFINKNLNKNITKTGKNEK